ncbi:MAG TPA: carbohydrate ABC transporter permease [Ktedonosporobacter sp.]|nr:carbohydrate ABC transporter permease [Ktedonosporobacter sp.]
MIQQHAASRVTARQRKEVLSRGLIYLSLLILVLVFIAPLLWDGLMALKSQPELTAFPVHVLPEHPEWQNFVLALTYINYGHYALNSFILATLHSVLVTMTSALVGFGFARLQARGKNVLFLVMLSTMMLPAILTVIPTYVIFARIGLINTYWPWVLWGLASTPYLSFLFRQFFSSIPTELEEAAIMDGCSYWRIFWQIFLPLSKPVIATAAILSFTAVWGDFFTPLIFLSGDNTTLSVALANGYADVNGHLLTNVLAAGTIFYIIPVLVLFFFAQRSFVQGIATAGLKG